MATGPGSQLAEAGCKTGQGDQGTSSPRIQVKSFLQPQTL